MDAARFQKSEGFRVLVDPGWVKSLRLHVRRKRQVRTNLRDEARTKPRAQSYFGTLGYFHVQLTFGDEDALVTGSMWRSQKFVNNARWTGQAPPEAQMPKKLGRSTLILEQLERCPELFDDERCPHL